MAACRLTLLGVLLLSVILHISLLCGVISMGTDSTAVTLHESEAIEEDDGGVDLEEDQEVLEVFQPTDEWQTIKEGQAIPAGLHVRINLATGEKEAKYLDEHQDSSEAASQEKVTGESNEEDKDVYKKEELEERLAKMKEDECDDCGDNEALVTGESNEEDKDVYKKDELEERLAKMKEDECDDCGDNEALIEEVKRRYRSIEELKKEFAELEVDMKTDYEIMTKLFEEYREHHSTERRKLILQDLEFYVHKVDNGVDLQSLGGWDIIISALNSTEEDIHSEAAHVLGSAVQSNPKAQVSAFDGGAMQPLLRLLSHSPSINVKKRALYGLSSLIRFFPFAQRKFLELGGLSVLSALMRETKSDYLPIQIKSVTLVHDLLIEQKNSLDLEMKEADEVAKERKQQYEKIHLVPMVIEGGWCDAVPMLLNVPDHDTREKILVSLNTLRLYCDYTSNQDLQHRLASLGEEYSKLAEEESLDDDGDDYFHSLLSTVDDIIKAL